MRFIHFADCHLDGFREAKLAKIGFENFTFVISKAIEKRVDFVLLAGDLFNSAIPRVDALKIAVMQLKRLQHNNIPVYAIPGSHDYSPYGKTMLDVLELAGLLKNVMKGEVSKEGRLQLEFTKDPSTGALITGILGKKGMLDKTLYENLDISKLAEDGFKIFLFHTAITELKTKALENMDSTSINILPEGFDYYAGGHVHIIKRFSADKHRQVVYPGPTFPNSFSELEELKSGWFVFYDSENKFEDEKGNQSPFKHVSIPNKKVVSLTIDATHKTPSQIEQEAKDCIEKEDLSQTILLLRFQGKISQGKAQDIPFKEVLKSAYEQGAYIVLKNTYKLISEEFEDIKSEEQDSEFLEENTIHEHLGKIKLPKHLQEKEAINELLQQLDIEPLEGEKKTTFTQRATERARTILEKEQKNKTKEEKNKKERVHGV